MREEIKYFPPMPIDLPFAVDMVGISYCDGSYRIERQKSSILVMEYVIKGQGMIRVDDESFSACEGDLYILPKDHRHIYYSDAKNPWTKIFFNIYGELPMKMLESYGLIGYRVIKECPMRHYFEQMLELAKNEKTIRKVVDGCSRIFHNLVIELYHFIQTENKVPYEAVQLKELLELHIHSTITINELSAKIGRSPDYTIKLFKKVYHKTPYAYLLDLKMQAAENLVCYTVLPIKEVGEQIGFYDAQYFSNMFKKYYGSSPLRYRKLKQVYLQSLR